MKITSLIQSAALAALVMLPAGAQAQHIVMAKCKVTEVAVFKNRVHAKCLLNGEVVVPFFAIPTSRASEATRYITLASTAMAMGGSLLMEYDVFESDSESYGCMVKDCRHPLSFQLLK